MKFQYTWRFFDVIHDGSLLLIECGLTLIFNLVVPTKVKSVPTKILHLENSVSRVLTLFCKIVKMQLDVDLHCMLLTIVLYEKFSLIQIFFGVLVVAPSQ
jgi:hypothetical protein